MKHAFWDRLLIVLCTLLLLAMAAALVGMITGLLPVDVVAQQANLLMGDRGARIVGGGVAAVLVIVAILLFWIILPRRKSRYSAFAIQQTEHGTLKISVKALEHLVQKCINQHTELTIVSSAIHSNEETVRVDLRVTLQSDINIPLAIASLQKQIKQYVEACSGVDVDEVRVVVEATVPPIPGTNSPYAIPEMMQPHLPKLLDGTAPASVLEPPSAVTEDTPAFPGVQSPPPSTQAETLWIDAMQSMDSPPSPPPTYEPPTAAQAEPEPTEPDEEAAPEDEDGQPMESSDSDMPTQTVPDWVLDDAGRAARVDDEVVEEEAP